MKKIYSLFTAIILLTSTAFAQPVRNWGTYYGGTMDDNINCTTADAIGNVYITGYTASTTGISTVGSHQPAYAGGGDAFMAKFNSAGVLQWATYYGGAQTEYGYAVAVDAVGNVYLAGSTTSATGISTVGSHQPAWAGSDDIFIVKFNSSGVRQWGTYYGGTGSEHRCALAIDPISGNICLAAVTNSTSGISTVGSHQPVYGGGTNDRYIVQFNSSGVRQWGTYYGGTGVEFVGATTYCFIATDPSGNIYLAGYTTSTSNISTVGSHQPALVGTNDLFLAKFSSGGVRQWATYYGGTGGEGIASVAVDGNGNSYLGGMTNSTSGITTVGSYQPTIGGFEDIVVAKFNSAGIRQWATYYGGPITENYPVLATYGVNMVYIGGTTTSTTAISTPGSHQPVYGGGSSGDLFLAAFDTAGTRQWGTYYGGSNNEFVPNIAPASGSLVYLSGLTVSTSAISSIGSHQPSFGGGFDDGFLAQLTLCSVPPTQPGTISGAVTVCNGATNTYSITAVPGATSYTWVLPGGWSGSSTTTSINATASATSGNITVTANNACGSSTAQTLAVTVSVPNVTASNSGAICIGNSATLTAGGASTYLWMPGSLTTNPVTVSPTVTTTYTVTGTDGNGCTNTATTTLTVNPLPTVTMSAANTSTCINWTTDLLTGTPVGGTFSGTGVTGTNFDPSVAGVGTWLVTYTYTDGNGCTNTATTNITVGLCTGTNQIANENEIIIYPNPFTSVVTLSLSKGLGLVTVYNTLGEVVYNSQLVKGNNEIDLSEVPSGVYFIKMISDEGTVTKKIVKQ